MSRRHRIVPAVAATLASAAILSPAAQARPAVAGGASGGSSGPAVERTVHDQPLANPVAVPPSGLNHGAGLIGRTQGIRIESSGGSDWIDVLTGATAGALVIAVCATGVGVGRRANPAT